jgi:hypothetical protein
MMVHPQNATPAYPTMMRAVSFVLLAQTTIAMPAIERAVNHQMKMWKYIR